MAQIHESKPGSRRKHKSKGKNVTFWHFQHPDSTVLNYNEVKSIRKDLQEDLEETLQQAWATWRTLDDNLPDRQLEFYFKIEAKYPLLRLCENHYKAELIPFSDYSHLFDKQFPSGDKPEPA